MSILLINSPIFIEKRAINSEDTLPPLGMGYLMSVLHDNGIAFQFIDAFAENKLINEIKREIAVSDFQNIGINAFSTNIDILKNLFHDRIGNKKLIIGGPATKALYKEIFSWDTNYPIDIVSGDGELILPDILSDNLKESPKAKYNQMRYFEIDKNSRYFNQDISRLKIYRDSFIEPMHNYYGQNEIPIVTSRGCPHNCSFCTAARSQNKDQVIRERNTSSIQQELLTLKIKYPEANSIRIVDDLFLKNEMSIQKAITIFSKFTFKWRSMAHISSFQNTVAETFTKLKVSGCTELFIGIESGSPRILKQIHKTTNTYHIKSIISKILSSGIHVKGYFILGFPGETKEDFELSYNLAKELYSLGGKHKGNFRTSVFQFRPYHGSEEYENLSSSKIADAKIKPNLVLNNIIGREEYNFSRGNFSVENDDILVNYIEKINSLNQEQ